MKKIISILICVCILMCSLAACGCSATAEDKEFTNRVIVIEECNLGFGVNSYILVDTNTGVLYQFIKSGYGGGLTVMLDADGKPLLWEVGRNHETNG